MMFSMLRANDRGLPPAIEMISCGEERGQGNLLGIQPWLTAADYCSAERLFSVLDGYFAAGKAAGWLNTGTVTVLPEYIGAWLAVAGEEEPVSRPSSMTRAMIALVLRHPFAFLRQYLQAGEARRAIAAIFRLKAPSMAADYQRVFSQLAARYRVHLVAGSTILPDPAIVNGAVVAGDGPLYNVSVLYAPDGRAISPLVRKVFPTAEEQPFLAAGKVEDLPVFDTPAGWLGILICADAWFPACYEQMHALGAEMIAVPSYGIHQNLDDIWPGYSGYPPPADVDPADIGHLTRREAWRKYALEGRLPSSGAQLGLNVFLHGDFWENTGSGQTVAIHGDATWECSKQGVGALVSLWR